MVELSVTKTAFPSGLSAMPVSSAAGVSISHVLYAIVWYAPAFWTKACKAVGFSNPVNGFATAVTVAKLTQEAVLLGWVQYATAAGVVGACY